MESGKSNQIVNIYHDSLLNSFKTYRHLSISSVHKKVVKGYLTFFRLTLFDKSQLSPSVVRNTRLPTFQLLLAMLKHIQDLTEYQAMPVLAPNVTVDEIFIRCGPPGKPDCLTNQTRSWLLII